MLLVLIINGISLIGSENILFFYSFWILTAALFAEIVFELKNSVFVFLRLAGLVLCAIISPAIVLFAIAGLLRTLRLKNFWIKTAVYSVSVFAIVFFSYYYVTHKPSIDYFVSFYSLSTAFLGVLALFLHIQEQIGLSLDSFGKKLAPEYFYDTIYYYLNDFQLPLILVNDQLKIIGVNNGFINLFEKYSKYELMSGNKLRLTDKLQEYFEKELVSLKNSSDNTSQWKFQSPDGKEFSVFSQKATNNKLEVFGYLFSITEFNENIVDSKRLKEQETNSKKLALIAGKAENSTFIVNSNGIIEWANQTAEKELGFEPNELLNKTYFDFFRHEKNNAEILDFMNLCFEMQNNFTMELLVKTKSNEFKVVEVEMELFDPQIEDNKFLIVHRDITLRFQLQSELKKAKNLAENASKLKSEFLSRMSHEIRTPLNAIIGVTNFMLEEKIGPEIESNLQLIQSSSQNLLDIVNDILDYSNLETGKIKRDNIRFNLHNLIRDIVRTHRNKATSKNLEFSYFIDPNIPLNVIGDASALSQVLVNIVDNAIKFTPAGTVNLAVESTDIVEGEIEVRFTVSDTGIGIDSQDQNAIFDLFTQIDSGTTRRYGGVGLGLTITKALVELMGGTITLESKVNKGSTFCFVIRLQIADIVKPSKESKPKATQEESLTTSETVTKIAEGSNNVAAAAQPKQLSETSLLLVEDNNINQFVAKQLLEKYKIKVTIAENGQEALEKLENQLFDLILMDIQMPIMNGFEATEHIRAGKHGINSITIPIVALSADVFPETKEKAIQMGMNDFITKPIKQAELIEKIQQALNMI